MKQRLYIYLQGVKTAVASRMAYRLDFFMSFSVMLIWEMVAPMVIFLIYRSGVSFPGWSFYEVILIQAVFMVAKGISYPCFFGIVWNTIIRVQEGTFDLLLIKPRSALFTVLVTGFDAEDLGKLAGGTLLLILALIHLPPPSLEHWAMFILFFLLAMIVLFGMAVALAATGIIWVGNFRLYEIFDSVTAFGIYPITIFSKSIQNIISYIIPVAIIGCFPASVLTGKPTPPLWGLAAGVTGFLILSLLYWNRMLSNYTSAGG